MNRKNVLAQTLILLLAVSIPLLLFCGAAFADDGWTPRENDRYWHGIAISSDGSYQTAVARGERIYTSSDNGVNWTAVESSRDWKAVAISEDGSYQTAVVDGGQIYTSTDYGATWTARDSDRNWWAVAMSGDGTYQTASVTDGYLYISSDHGVTWTPWENRMLWRGIAISADGSHQTAVVYGRQIYTSTDYGATWIARASGRNWWAVAMSDDGMYQTAAVPYGYLYTSSDHGVTWTAVEKARDWYSIAMSSDGMVQTAVEFDGRIYTSKDRGVSWVPRESDRYWVGIAVSSDGLRQSAVASHGKIYTFSDPILSWTAHDSTRNWYSIAMSDDGTYQTAGVWNGQIHTSSDCGITWTALGEYGRWYAVAMSADGSIQAAYNLLDGYYCTSSDYGATWTKRVEGVTGWMSIAMSDDGVYQTGVAWNGRIFVSSDFGVSFTECEGTRYWDTVVMSSDGSWQAATTYDGYIYISSDYGVTWTPCATARQWTGIAMSADGSRLTAGTRGGRIYTSADYGATWTARESTRSWGKIAMSDDGSKQTAVVFDGRIYTSTDYGVTWTRCESLRDWRGIAMSADGLKQSAVANGGQIYTNNAIPTVSTTAASSMTRVSASSGGNVTEQGWYSVTDRGVCWSSSPVPNTSDSHTSDGSSTGGFTSSVTGLSPGTTYYLRAYATNSEGTAYGNEISFTTSEAVPGSSWFLPEGTTAWGFSTYITIVNPNDVEVPAEVTYMPTGAPNWSDPVTLPPNSQTTILNDSIVEKIGQADFSTRVDVADYSLPIAVDRTMEWTGPGAAAPEGHSSVGVTDPATTWYLSEGSTNWGFETWLLIQNPGDSEATCEVIYMIEGKGPQTKTHKVPANSRESYSMADDIGAEDASIKVVSDIPVIAERAMYRNNRREGHDSIGTTTPANDFFLAEGAVGYDSAYITYILVQNPQDTENDVDITFLTGTGEVEGPSLNMGPNSRWTVRVNDHLPLHNDVSTSVHGEQPIIAERAMYWNSPAGEACHNSVGMSEAHTSFFLPDGQSSNGRETWTLVQNPNDTDVTVEVTYLTPTGTGNVTETETVAPKSRRSFSMAEQSGINGRAAILVRCMTPGRKIMCERAMYWADRAAGTDTIGGFAD